VLVQRLNGVLLHDSFVFEDCLQWSLRQFSSIFSKPLGILDTKGIIIIIITIIIKTSCDLYGLSES